MSPIMPQREERQRVTTNWRRTWGSQTHFQSPFVLINKKQIEEQSITTYIFFLFCTGCTVVHTYMTYVPAGIVYFLLQFRSTHIEISSQESLPTATPTTSLLRTTTFLLCLTWV